MTRSDPPSASASPRGKVARLSLRQFGTYVLFASLSVLFAACLVAYFVTRAESPLWRTAEMPRLPIGLWLSTLLIFCISAAFQGALAAVRKNHPGALVRRLWIGTGLIALFLFAQLQNWLAMYHGMFAATMRTLYPYTFYMLTGLHAAHVVGGLIPVALVLGRAHRREYSSSSHEGVLLCVQYWHYLGVVWLVLFSVLELATG
jgi:cytochrome c oxidase subunit 3